MLVVTSAEEVSKGIVDRPYESMTGVDYKCIRQLIAAALESYAKEKVEEAMQQEMGILALNIANRAKLEERAYWQEFIKLNYHNEANARIQGVKEERERILKFLTCAEIPGCWNWKAARNDKGYGQFDREYAHRVSYEMFVGPIPEGLQIDHKCPNHSCINPSHLRPLTNRENGLIGEGICARNFRKSHCKNGHEFTPENTKQYRNTRVCKICCTERNAKRYLNEE